MGVPEKGRGLNYMGVVDATVGVANISFSFT